MAARATGAEDGAVAPQRGRQRLRRMRDVAERQRREAEVVQKDAFLSRVANRT